MGMFLSLTSVLGKTHSEVVNCLNNYAKSVHGGLEKENLTTENDNCCVIDEANGNTTILNPNGYLEWDASSAFISKELKAPVFSFHIHDGDLWMYLLFFNGEVVDQFNPIPDYWNDNVSDEEIESFKGNAKTIAKYVSGLKPSDIEKYLVRWDLEAEENDKAYPDDEFTQEDWQLIDFMKRLGLSYPLDDNGNPKGQTYNLWTNELQLKNKTLNDLDTLNIRNADNKLKPWWKFW